LNPRGPVGPQALKACVIGERYILSTRLSDPGSAGFWLLVYKNFKSKNKKKSLAGGPSSDETINFATNPKPGTAVLSVYMSCLEYPTCIKTAQFEANDERG